MADISPNDIINQSFHRSFRGYSTEEVDDFLQEVSDTLFRVMEDNQRLRAQLDDLRDRVKHYQDTENLINNALVLAEKTGEEIRARATVQAEQIQREAEDKIREERREIEQLLQFRQRVIDEIRAQLQTHLSLLENQEQRGRLGGLV